MTTIILTVTDLELMAGQAVKFIVLALLVFGVILNLYLIKKESERKRKAIRMVIAMLLLSLCVPIVKWILIEDSLLRHGEYAAGVTVGRCEVFGKGIGIEFEYEVNGKKYRNCNTFHPIPIDSIEMPGGKYSVRYSERFPEEGRIDFHKKLE